MIKWIFVVQQLTKFPGDFIRWISSLFIYFQYFYGLRKYSSSLSTKLIIPHSVFFTNIWSLLWISVDILIFSQHIRISNKFTFKLSLTSTIFVTVEIVFSYPFQLSSNAFTAIKLNWRWTRKPLKIRQSIVHTHSAYKRSAKYTQPHCSTFQSELVSVSLLQTVSQAVTGRELRAIEQASERVSVRTAYISKKHGYNV